jgi:hypothetical protein
MILLHSPKYHLKSKRAVERAVQIIEGPLHTSDFGNVNNGIKRNTTQQMWTHLLGDATACDLEHYYSSASHDHVAKYYLPTKPWVNPFSL